MIIALCTSTVMQAITFQLTTTQAGQLKSLLTTNDLNACDYLVLQGPIDARDFKTLRDAMPALATVELSQTNVVAYTGNEGTEGTDEFTYPANEIPSDAFNNKSILTTVALPSACTKIGKYAFYNCSGLTTFPTQNNITSIGANAFALCSGLESISISRYVNTIGEKAFFRCKADITVASDNANYSSQDGVLFNKSKTILFQCPKLKSGSYTLPATVITIEQSAFYACTNLTGITLPTALTTIKASAFYGCTGLTAMALPANLTTIESSAFYQCKELTSLTIPSKVTTLGVSFANACEKLKTVSIPASVTSMGKDIFWGCSALTSIYVSNPTPLILPVNDDVFSGVDKTSCTLYVPVGSKSVYMDADQWENFTNIIEATSTAMNNNLSKPITATIENNRLTLSNLQSGTLAVVYNMQGVVILEQNVIGNNLSIELPKRGIYIVNTNGRSTKIMY